MKLKHNNFQVKQCGTFINKEYPFMHATLDFLCSCDCSGLGCGEVKCPYCNDDHDFDNYLFKKSFCLQRNEHSETGFSLKRDHDYYYQVQQQLHTTKREYCDFVVYATSSSDSKFVCERILPYNSLWDSLVPKLCSF